MLSLIMIYVILIPTALSITIYCIVGIHVLTGYPLYYVVKNKKSSTAFKNYLDSFEKLLCLGSPAFSSVTFFTLTSFLTLLLVGSDILKIEIFYIVLGMSNTISLWYIVYIVDNYYGE